MQTMCTSEKFKSDGDVQWEWVQDPHCPFQAGRLSLQAVAYQYTAAIQSCLTAEAAAAVCVMHRSSCALNKTAYNVLVAITCYLY